LHQRSSLAAIGPRVLLLAPAVRAAFAVGAMAMCICAGLSLHGIGKAAKTDGERAVLQRDVIGHPQAAPRPCGAQSIFIPGIVFQWQAELRSSIVSWPQRFTGSVACCTCSDIHPTFRASPVRGMRSSRPCSALLLWKPWNKINPCINT
jgi:hypothetical protein